MKCELTLALLDFTSEKIWQAKISTDNFGLKGE